MLKKNFLRKKFLRKKKVQKFVNVGLSFKQPFKLLVLFLVTGSSRLAQGTLEPCLTSILISVMSSPPVLARMELLSASSSQPQILQWPHLGLPAIGI